MQLNIRAFRLLAVAIFLGTTAMANTFTNSTTLPVRKVVLPNGLTVLVREDRSAPVVTAQAWCRAGSITEGKWTGAGLSHVLEHMLFKGTAKRGVAAIAQEIENKGGYINAYTSFEQTVFYINIPSENWHTAVDILADCVMNATIPEAELLKEKQVILREMAMNVDDPDRRASRMVWETAYLVHPYRFTVIGYPDIYNRITRDDVMRYYKQMYVPNNLIFVIVGNINADKVIAHLRELTKDFKMGAIDPTPVPDEPPQLSARERHEEAEIQLSKVYLSWHVPPITDADVYPLDVLAILAGQGRSSRLYREIQQKRGLVHGIETSCYTPRYSGLFMVEASADGDKRDAAIAAIREELKKFKHEPISDDELHKAIKISITSHLDRLKTMEGQAFDIGGNEVLVGDPNFGDQYLENLRKVTAQDVQRVAARYVTDHNLTITTLDPTGTNVKAKTETTAQAAIKIQKFELPNGLRLLVREDPKLPFVNFRAMVKGGVIAETAADNGITKLAARMLLKGTSTRSADQISESIESVGGDISYFAGNNSFGVTANVLNEDFDLGLDLLADVLQNPTFPQDKLDRERTVQLAEYKAEQDHILRAAQQALRTTMFHEHPYRLNQLGTPESLSTLTRDKLSEFQRRYVAPNNMVLTIFGKVDAAEVRRKIEAKFGAMQSAKVEVPAAKPETLAASISKEENKPKEQAVVLIGYSGATMFSPDRFALELLDEAYSGQGSRIFLRLRDELGLCYYVGAYQLLGLDPGYFVFYVGTTPQNAAVCEKEFFAELDKLQANGLTAAELDRAKNSLIGQRKVHMQDNADLSMTVGLDELYGLGYDFHETAEAKYRAVTSDDIKRVALKYFADKPHAVIVVKPAAKPQ